MNPLENDSDDGDGPRMNGKAAFYRDKDGREIPIRIVKLPAGVNLSAEREGPCPGNFAGETCYGGKLTFSVKNTFSQSDYDMQYHVFDADELMSDTARINLKIRLKIPIHHQVVVVHLEFGDCSDY